MVTQLRDLIRTEGVVGKRKNRILQFLESGKNIAGVVLAVIAAVALTSGGPKRLAEDLHVVQVGPLYIHCCRLVSKSTFSDLSPSKP